MIHIGFLIWMLIYPLIIKIISIGTEDIPKKEHEKYSHQWKKQIAGELGKGTGSIIRGIIYLYIGYKLW